MTARAMSCSVDDVLFCIVCDARCVEPFCSDRCRERYEGRASAVRRLMHFATRATTAPLGSVEQWDARTSANDARAALSIALGKPLDSIDPARGTA